MTIQPSPYEIIRAIQDQQRATDRLVQILVGLLDKSAPDPIMSTALSILPVAADRPHRRAVGDAGRPPVLVELDGVEIRTTERRAKIITMLKSEALGLTDLVRRRAVPNTKAASSQLRDINLDLERSGSPFRLVSDRAHPSRRAARYRLAIPSEIAPPGRLPAVQNEGAGGERPQEGSEACAAGEGVLAISAHSDQFVTSTGAEEGVPAPADPAPAADDKSSPDGASAMVGGFLVAAAPSHAEVTSGCGDVEMIAVEDAVDLPGVTGGESAAPAIKPAAKASRLPIEPGDLIAVEIKQRRIQTSHGVYEVGGANLARALDRLKGGQMFGLDVIARVAGWPNADVAKTALGFERPRLAEHGLDLYLDKINVRLRSAS